MRIIINIKLIIIHPWYGLLFIKTPNIIDIEVIDIEVKSISVIFSYLYGKYTEEIIAYIIKTKNTNIPFILTSYEYKFSIITIKIFIYILINSQKYIFSLNSLYKNPYFSLFKIANN